MQNSDFFPPNKIEYSSKKKKSALDKMLVREYTTGVGNTVIAVMFSKL